MPLAIINDVGCNPAHFMRKQLARAPDAALHLVGIIRVTVSSHRSRKALQAGVRQKPGHRLRLAQASTKTRRRLVGNGGAQGVRDRQNGRLRENRAAAAKAAFVILLGISKRRSGRPRRPWNRRRR